MSRTMSNRLVAYYPSITTKEFAPIVRSSRCLRQFSNTSRQGADDGMKWSPIPPSSSRATPQAPARSPSLNPNAAAAPRGSLGMLGSLLNTQQSERGRASPRYQFDSENLLNSVDEMEQELNEKPHLLSIYATRHNTHINFSRPWTAADSKPGEPAKSGYNPLIALSAGNLGFRKSARKHYDSAFQTASYVMARMQERGWNQEIKKLEVHLRGFGAGREAVTKAILGSEGRFIRDKIVRVADNTRLKFGGTRSKKPRRLG